MTTKREWCMTFKLKPTIIDGLNFGPEHTALTNDLVLPGSGEWRLVSHNVQAGSPVIISWCWERDIEIPEEEKEK